MKDILTNTLSKEQKENIFKIALNYALENLAKENNTNITEIKKLYSKRKIKIEFYKNNFNIELNRCARIDESLLNK